MKQNLLILIIAVLSPLGLWAQSKPSKAEVDAANIIRYSNSTITIANAYNQDLNTYADILKNADYNLDRVLKNPNLQPFFINCNILSVNNTQLQDYTKALTAVQAFAEKDGIKAAVSEGQNSIKDISQWCSQLSDYFNNKAYTDDQNSSQYTLIKDSLMAHMIAAKAAWGEAGRLSSVAGSNAELVFLEKSPIASFVIPMKKDLIEFDAILSSLNNKTSDLTTIRSQLESLETTIEKNKDLSDKPVSKLSDYYYREVYQNYYKDLGFCVSHLIKAVDLMQNSPDDTERINSSYQYLKSYYNKTIDDYNTFINQ